MSGAVLAYGASMRTSGSRDAENAMTVDIPRKLRDEEYGTHLVKCYLATNSAGRARYSGAYFDRLGGGGDRPEIAFHFTAEDLVAVSMLSVRIDGYHALHVLHYQARELNSLLAAIPPNLTLTDPQAADLIAEGGPAQALWQAISDIHPRPEYDRVGPIAAGKLLARKRPHLIPVYDSRVKKVLSRPRVDRSWWHDLRAQLINDQDLVLQLESVRGRADAGHMSLLRIFDVMCWMFSWKDEDGTGSTATKPGHAGTTSAPGSPPPRPPRSANRWRLPY